MENNSSEWEINSVILEINSAVTKNLSVIIETNSVILEGYSACRATISAYWVILSATRFEDSAITESLIINMLNYFDLINHKKQNPHCFQWGFVSVLIKSFAIAYLLITRSVFTSVPCVTIILYTPEG